MQEAQVTARFTLATSTLEVHARVDTEEGPFRFVLRVRDLGVEVMLPEGGASEASER